MQKETLVWEMVLGDLGAKTGHDEDKKGATNSCRIGRVVERPGPGASHDEIIEYRRYLMSEHGITCHFHDSWCLMFVLLDHEVTDDEDPLVELGSHSDGGEDNFEEGASLLLMTRGRPLHQAQRRPLNQLLTLLRRSSIGVTLRMPMLLYVVLGLGKQSALTPVSSILISQKNHSKYDLDSQFCDFHSSTRMRGTL